MKISGTHPTIGNYITIREVAKLLKIHSLTLRRWDKSGHLKAERVNGLRVYSVDELQKRLDAGQI